MVRHRGKTRPAKCICVVRIKPEVYRQMTRKAQRQAHRLGAGFHYPPWDWKYHGIIRVRFQNNLNNLMDFMHGGKHA